ncbi:hypothetical protein QQM79_01940 [Marinobacteraceae bacterium S3BR75-40.1]
MTDELLDVTEMGQLAGAAELQLWMAALALLVKDAKAYWQERATDGSTQDDREEAFDALIQCTWMLRRICTYTGHDAEWLSSGFIRWCENDVA